MIRDAHEHNETITPNDFELERLRAVLPEYFDSNGAFMIDRLQETLHAGEVNLAKEGYELKFLGKSYAKYLTSTETETVLVPDLEHNSEPDNKDSENLYIVGDNLDALKHLRGSYAGQVKCIYIDPPYNTGSDGFVYNDDFGFTPSQLVDKIGLSEEEAQRVLDLQGKSSHSAWLAFMYPRLQLAKELLADDGVIFISIDDNEQANLRLVCDEIFGENSFIGTFVQDKGNSKSDSNDIQKNHEYIHCYRSPTPKADSASLVSVSTIRRNVLEESGRYFYLSDPITTRAKGGVLSARPNLGFTIYFNEVDSELIPVVDYNRELAKDPYAGDEIYQDDTALIERGFVPIRPPRVRGQLGAWTWGLERVKENSDSLFVVKNRDSFTVKKRVFVDADSVINEGGKLYCDTISPATPRSLLKFSTNAGTERLSELLGTDTFDYPKNGDMIAYLISLVVDKGDIVLDFFSGSATTADAVMNLNVEKNLALRYLLVQLPEPISDENQTLRSKFGTIDRIGRARIESVARELKKKTNNSDAFDLGFRLYRLGEPSGEVLDQLESFDPEQADALFAGDYVSKFGLDGTPGHDTVLATWLVKDGHGLTATPERAKLAGYELDVCGDSAYIIDAGLTSNDVVALVRMLENGELTTSRVVVFGYSVEFSVMHELKKNLAVLRSGKTVTVIERF